MRKSEFLQELKEALQGEVSGRVLQENLRYYDNYISQEMAGGRGEEDVTEEIGSPRLIARTIIDSSGAAGDIPEQGGYYENQGGGYGQQENRKGSGFRYFNLNKWYWKLLLLVVVGLFMFTVITVIGGIFALLMRFAGPIILIWLIYIFIRSLRR